MWGLGRMGVWSNGGQAGGGGGGKWSTGGGVHLGGLDTDVSASNMRLWISGNTRTHPMRVRRPPCECLVRTKHSPIRGMWLGAPQSQFCKGEYQ